MCKHEVQGKQLSLGKLTGALHVHKVQCGRSVTRSRRGMTDVLRPSVHMFVDGDYTLTRPDLPGTGFLGKDRGFGMFILGTEATRNVEEFTEVLLSSRE